MYDDETGGIITSWLVQVVLFLAVIAVIGFEVITIAVTSINLEDDARDVARAAAQAYGGERQLTSAREAAQHTAEEREVTLVQVTEDDGVVSAEVTKRADTLFTHRIGFLEDLVLAEATGRARWR